MQSLIIKLTLLITLLSGFIFAPKLSLAATALDCTRTDLSSKEQIQCGACSAAGGTCDPTTASKSLSDTVKDIINIISVIAGALAVIMIIVGGFRFVTSAGNAEATKSARNTILYAVIGLIIIAMAQIIVHFVLNSVTNTNSTGSGGSAGSQSTGSGRTGAGSGERPN